ncbi:MAG TPA: galactose-1-phosphate uridylyltransferase [Acidimicrobiales bacterium]|nr:galactose-1-phosphate uridylyltransferase [Acidimicrobiales bacterium]
MTERRFDPTTGEWVTFATHRQNRTYKPADFCPLCPTLPGREPTEIPYPSFEVVTFDNLFPSYSPWPPVPDVEPTDLYPTAPAAGRCEVVVYSDDHTVTFSELDGARVRMLVDVWADRTAVLGAEAAIDYVMPFENKGETVGTTLSHPHGQIYGYPEVPPRPRRELEAALAHHARVGRCVHCDVLAAELVDGRRVVAADAGWVAWVPFWARFPYEVHVAPTAHRSALPELDDAERDGLAHILSVVARSYDRLWGFSLPYVMAFHQQPTDGDPGWAPVSHLHVEFAPPNRAPDRLKYLAGSELAGGAFVTDVAPETAAAELRAARLALS